MYKKALIKSFGLLIILCLVGINGKAQKKGYSDGYIISLGGDKVQGLVKDRSREPFTELYSRIRFKAEDAGFRKKYSPNQILGYGYGNTYYESLPLREEMVALVFKYHVTNGYDRQFLRLVEKNEHLTYYHKEYIDDDSNYLDYFPLFHKNGSNEMVRVTQGILGLKKKRLTEYFRDCPALINAIERKELTEVLEVFDFYTTNCAGRYPSR